MDWILVLKIVVATIWGIAAIRGILDGSVNHSFSEIFIGTIFITLTNILMFV